MQIYSNPCVTVDYDEDKDCLAMTWKKFTRSEILRDAYSQVISFLKSRYPKHCLLDKTHIKVISPEDQIWLANEWAVKLNRALKLAFVDSVDVFGQISIKNVVNRIEQKEDVRLELRVFKEKTEAESWLNE